MKPLATKAEYDQFLVDAGGKLVVIDFFADWCGPCKMIAPKLLAMETEYPDVLFAKVNVDENEETAEEAGISAMPTFIFMKDGKKVETITGANEAKIRDSIQKFK